MNHSKHDLTHKKYIKARKELDNIHDQLRNTPWVELKEPYQQGWNLTVVLRDDIARSDAAPILQGILDKFGRHGSIHNPRWVTKIRKKPCIDDANQLLFKRLSYYLGVQAVNSRTYSILSAQEKKYFTKCSPFIDKYRYNGYETYEFNLRSHYLLTKVTKRIVTHTKDINPVLLKREAELDAILAPYWRACGDRYYKQYFKNRSERRRIRVELSNLKLNYFEID